MDCELRNWTGTQLAEVKIADSYSHLSVSEATPPIMHTLNR